MREFRQEALGIAVLLLVLLAPCSQASAAIYWGHSSVIGRANNDGSEALTKTTGFIANTWTPYIGSSCGVAVNDTHIYWADSEWGRIGRATLDGYTELDFDFIGGADEPCGVVVDDSHVYWANRDGNSIGRARLDGEGVDQGFVEGVNGPCGVAVDDEFVYWAGRGPNVAGRALLHGGNKEPALIEGSEYHEYCGVAVSGEHLFWGGYDESIGRVGVNGSDPDPDFIENVGEPCGLATYGSRLYWAEDSPRYGRISRARLSGSDVERGVVDGISSLNCGSVAVDSLGALTPAPPPPVSDYRIAKMKRNKRRGIVYVAVDLAGPGSFSAWVPGMRVTVLPERVRQGGYLAGGRKWLKITPMRERGDGSRCILRALRRGWIVKRALETHFSEPGKILLVKKKRLRFFRTQPGRKAKRPRQATWCYAKPPLQRRPAGYRAAGGSAQRLSAGGPSRSYLRR